MEGTIFLVHGTGVRLPGFQASFALAQKAAREAGLGGRFVPCAWGDALGVVFEGKSLPDGPGPEAEARDAADLAEWDWLFDDPLHELFMLTMPDATAAGLPSLAGAQAWERVKRYTPSLELAALLDRHGMRAAWDTAWSRVTQQSELPQEAFRASGNEVPDAGHALARALVAELHRQLVAAGEPGPNRVLRQAIIERLRTDWNLQVLGPGRFMLRLAQRRATRIARRNRERLTEIAAFPIGDILLYQAHYQAIHAYLRNKIVQEATPPVTVIGHSLGGIASFDMLATAGAPPVDHLVTVGSQVPLLYELGALSSIPPNACFPNLPPWLNVYDRDDFLSFSAKALFASVRDEEVPSGQPFPDSHGGYLGNEAFWRLVRTFVAGPG